MDEPRPKRKPVAARRRRGAKPRTQLSQHIKTVAFLFKASGGALFVFGTTGALFRLLELTQVNVLLFILAALPIWLQGIMIVCGGVMFPVGIGLRRYHPTARTAAFWVVPPLLLASAFVAITGAGLTGLAAGVGASLLSHMTLSLTLIAVLFGLAWVFALLTLLPRRAKAEYERLRAAHLAAIERAEEELEEEPEE